MAIDQSHFIAARFHDPKAARDYLEKLRWPNGPACTRCGATKRISVLRDRPRRAGLYQCRICRNSFTVATGTAFEYSKISLDKWLFAIALIMSSRIKVRPKNIERMLGVTYTTAWFMTRRLREAFSHDDRIQSLLKPTSR